MKVHGSEQREAAEWEWEVSRIAAHPHTLFLCYGLACVYVIMGVQTVFGGVV